MKSPLSTRLLSAAALCALALSPAHAQDPAPADEAPAEAAPETPDPGAQAAPEAPEPAPGTPDATAPEAEAPVEAAPDGEAPAASPEGEAAAPAEPEVLGIVRETHGEWEVRCVPDGSECFLYQLALDEEQNPVAEFILVALPTGQEAAAGVTIVTPLGSLLPAGIGISVDGREIDRYGFLTCTLSGCLARIGLEQATVDALKRGRVATLQVASVELPDEPVTLELSLTGFTAAYDSLDIPAAPAQ